MLEAIIVGALTAWYLGVRTGVIAAIVTAVALVIASVVPGLTMAVYALVIAWSAALYYFGPKLGKKGGKGAKNSFSLFATVSSSMGQASEWAKKTFGRNS